MRSAWPRLYVFVAAPVLLFLALMFPLGEPPDEATQLARAASVLRAQPVGRRVQLPHPVDGAPVTVAGVDINPGFLAPLHAPVPSSDAAHKPFTLPQLEGAWRQTWPVGRVFVEASNTASYLPMFYIPTAVGLGAARLLGARPMPADLAGRLAGALFCLGAGALALRLARRGQAALFAVLTLPMTLHLSAAINQDGPLIAAAVLAAALFTRPDRRSYWAGVAALACVCAAKPSYLPLAGVALLPLGGGSWSVRQHGVGAAVVVGCTLTWAAVAAIWAAVPFWRPPYHPGPLWPGDPAILFRTTDPAAQLQTLLHHPLATLSLPFTTLYGDWGLMLPAAVGALGPLDFALPHWLYQTWYFALAATGAGMLLGLLMPPGNRPPRWASAAAGFAVLAACYGVFLLQYFAWTAVGADHVEGVQGRYVLPLLAILAGAWPGPGGWAGRLLAAPVIVASLLGAAALPLLTVWRFYLH